MEHLDENTVLEFIQGTLASEQAEAVERHVDDCESCRVLLSELARCLESSQGDAAGTLAGARDYRGGSVATSDDAIPLPSGRVSGLVGGQVIAERYRIIRLLGSGAMGSVYEVDDLELNERVALKLLRPELKNVPELLDRMHQETVLGRRITHPNVCRLYDLGSAGDATFVTMELVRGESLDQRLAGGAVGEIADTALIQICAALEAAHAQGVVHRDLKPANIMIDERGKVTVMDFGLARDLRGDRSRSGMLIGSPAYWSPEQARGQRATERSDVYAVGMIACDLFGARRPALGGRVRLDEVPTRYRPILRRCLAADEDERYGTARAVLDDLLAASRAEKRIRRAVLLAAVFGGSLLVALVITWQLVRRSAEPRRGGHAAASDARQLARGPAATDARTAAVRVPGAAADVRADRAQDASGSIAADARGRARRRPNRRRVARKRTVAADRPLDGGVRSTTKANDRAAARRRTIAERLKALEKGRRARGVLLLDVPGYGGRLSAGRKALASGRLEEAAAAIGRAESLLRAARIDGPFIKRKLTRLNKLLAAKKLDPAKAKRLRATFAKVHSRYFAGDYQGANAHLNAIRRGLRN